MGYIKIVGLGCLLGVPPKAAPMWYSIRVTLKECGVPES